MELEKHTLSELDKLSELDRLRWLVANSTPDRIAKNALAGRRWMRPVCRGIGVTSERVMDWRGAYIEETNVCRLCNGYGYLDHPPKRVQVVTEKRA